MPEGRAAGRGRQGGLERLRDIVQLVRQLPAHFRSVNVLASAADVHAATDPAVDAAPRAPLVKAKRIYWENLKPGMCVRHPSSASALYITVVDCSATHDAEVTLRALLTGTRKWPGDDAVDAAAEATCNSAFASFVGVPFEQSRLETDYYTTDRTGWSAGDRRLVCLVYDPDDTTLTRSLRGSHL